MQSLPPQINPYAARQTDGVFRQADWYLSSACHYFNGIGYVTIGYLICALPFWFHELLLDKSMPMGEKIGPPVVMLAMFIFFGAMLKTARQLPKDFERCYKRARWFGILAGAFGFPILTIPAFIGVSRLNTYRNLINPQSSVSTS